MANDSSSAGYLAPGSEPDYDDDLDDVLQAAVVGITGLPGNLVRPRWQPNPPQQPEFDVNWCAFGVTRVSGDTFSYQGFDPTANDANGAVSLEEDELLYCLASFYGPNAMRNCKRLRAGLAIGQNRAMLASNNVALVEVGESVNLPALLQEKWVKRVDVTVTFRRRTHRSFSILSIESGDVGLDNEHYVTPLTISNS